MYCYLNGEILKTENAKVSIFDIGIMRGFGVYEAMSTFGPKIFMWQDHLDRFKKTAKFLDIEVPISDNDLEEVCYELINKNGFKRSNIKFILTGGNAIEGILYDKNKPTFYVLVEEWKPIDNKNYTEGAKVGLLDNLRQYPEYKTTDYITAVKAYDKMKEIGELETLYKHNGFILECATSNFFVVKDGKIFTPKDNILKGITRKVVIDLAKNIDIQIEERDISEGEMFRADECFLTSSFKDIVPVVSVGGKKIGDGKVGEITKRIMSEFDLFTKS